MHHRCSYVGCKEAVTVAFEGGYCVGHFISACYKCLEQSAEPLVGDGRERNGGLQRDSLIEIVDKVTSLTLNSIAFTNLERGQLMDILLWTCDLLSTRTHRGNGSKSFVNI
jgi:hypothetical protein